LTAEILLIGESIADERALHPLVMAGYGAACAPRSVLQTRGAPSVLHLFRVALQVAYYQTDAVGLVVCVDANSMPMHNPAHELGGADPRCRVCFLRKVRADWEARRRVRPERGAMHVAIGCAAPAIEAWLRFGLDPRLNEVWAGQLGASHRDMAKRQLKRDVYGTDDPSLDLEVSGMEREARRLVARIDDLAQAFPHPFGSMLAAIRRFPGATAPAPCPGEQA
jgi:hypothetical protein